MKSLILFTFLSFSAFAQTVVSSISPESGPDTGGTVVRITGNHLSPDVVCALPCPSRVTFGGVTVDGTNESDQALVATTPPHAAGAVDVTVFVPGNDAITVHDGFMFTATSQAVYEQVLLPIYIDGTVPGANGTQWKTDLWIRNDGTETTAFAPGTCPSDACGRVFPPTFGLEAQFALHNHEQLASAGRANPSQLVYISKTPAPHISMNLRVADVSRQDLNAGTDVPVIRESDFHTDPVQLLNIPIEPATSRVLLRIYDVTFTDAQYAVAVYPQTEAPGLSEHSVFVHAVTKQSGDFRTEAAYAQVDLTSAVQMAGPVRVEVRPLNPGSRFWAFASITNNQTQLVTLVRP